MTAQLVVISGCSGGGKSTLLAELARRGFRAFEEPGRRIVKEELARGGDALPWTNPAAFAQRCIALSLANIAAALAQDGVSFCDRSLVDAVSALEHMGRAVPERARSALAERPYHRIVFMTPPWPELFQQDAERRHNFADACAEYDRLLRAYADNGHRLVLIPKIEPVERATFVANHLRENRVLEPF